MMLPSVRCYHLSADAAIKPNEFFILCKEDNAGKPGIKPWANSFVVTASNEEMKDFYFWLTYGLFKAKSFKPLHRGSVIQYVNIGEVRHTITAAAQVLYPKWQEFKTIVQQLELLEQRKNNLAQILKSTTTLQEYLIRSYLQQQGVKS